MRIALTSDLHGHLPKLPDADMYIIAGDLCPDFGPGTAFGSGMQEGWLHMKFANWLGSKLDKTYATLGNHDFVRKPQLEGLPIFVDEELLIAGLRVWFTPWSNLFGGWAWMKPASELEGIYAKIPEGVDIIVSHGPAYGYGDRVPDRYLVGPRKDEDPHVGSKELLATLDRVKPQLLVCGHIHDGHGEYQYRDTRIINASLVNEAYKAVNPIVEIDL